MAGTDTAEIVRRWLVRLAWTRPANLDRQEIRDFIALDNPAAAIVLDELVADKAKQLLDHPNLGRPGRFEGTRELVAHQNYILVYDQDGDTVRILRVLHASRQWPRSRTGSDH